MGRARIRAAVVALVLLLLAGGLAALALTRSSGTAAVPTRPAASPAARTSAPARTGPALTVPPSPGGNTASDLPTDLPAPTDTPSPSAGAAATATATATAGPPVGSGPTLGSGPAPTPITVVPTSPPGPVSPPGSGAGGYTLTGVTASVGTCLWDESGRTTECPVTAVFSYDPGGTSTSQGWAVVVDSLNLDREICRGCSAGPVTLPARPASAVAINGLEVTATFPLLLSSGQTPSGCTQSWLHVDASGLSSSNTDFLGAQGC